MAALRRSHKYLAILGALLLIAGAVFFVYPRAPGEIAVTPTPSFTATATPTASAPTPAPTPPATPSPTPSPTPTPYVPDWSWLGAEAEYRYNILWEPHEFDADRPLELLRVVMLPEDQREDMRRIIARWAALYPPDHFNRYVGDILCYRSIDVPVLDDEDRLLYDDQSNIIYETLYGATSGGTIIITNRFSSEREILRALVHEMAHLEWNKATGLAPERTLVEAAFRSLNDGSVYWAEQEGIESTSDIPGWRSTDGKADWNEGWARRYGSFSFDEDLATVSEKVVMGEMALYAGYETLYRKMEAVASWRWSLHPDFTEEYFLRVLPDHLGIIR